MRIEAGARKFRALLFTFVLLAMAPLPAWAMDDAKPDPSSIEFFEKQVRPLLVSNASRAMARPSSSSSSELILAKRC